MSLIDPNRLHFRLIVVLRNGNFANKLIGWLYKRQAMLGRNSYFRDMTAIWFNEQNIQIKYSGLVQSLMLLIEK